MFYTIAGMTGVLFAGILIGATFLKNFCPEGPYLKTFRFQILIGLICLIFLVMSGYVNNTRNEAHENAIWVMSGCRGSLQMEVVSEFQQFDSTQRLKTYLLLKDDDHYTVVLKPAHIGVPNNDGYLFTLDQKTNSAGIQTKILALARSY